MKIEPKDNRPLDIWYSTTFAKIFYSILLIIGLIWLINYLIPDDYCFEQNRRLTDKEYILIVLDKFIKEGRIKVHGWDNTAETYLLHHPNCCNVFRNEHTGYYDDGQQVIISYELSDKFKELERATHYTSLTLVSACGEPFKFYGGF